MPGQEHNMRAVQIQKESGRRWTPSGYITASGIWALGLLIALIIETYTKHVMSVLVYIPIHTTLEFVSIVVSYAVFVVGWYGYKQTRNRQDLFIAIAFLAVGTIDFIHTLSYKGMPDFLGVNTVGKAAAYWLVARFIGGASLLIAAFIAPLGRNRWIRPGVLLPVMSMAVIGIVALFTIYTTPVSNMMYRPESDLATGEKPGLTMFKIYLEYLVIAVYIAAFWALGRIRGMKTDSIVILRIAIIFSIGSEFCFTLYQSPYDAHNLLGHIYKAASYYLVLQALFVSSLRRPYTELSHTKGRLQESFTSIGEALGSGLHKDSTLRQIAALTRQMFSADVSAIGELKADGMIEVATFDGMDLKPFSVPVDNSLADEAFSAMSPQVIADITNYTKKLHPEPAKSGLRSFVLAPIVRDGRPVGAIYVGSVQIARFTEEDAEILKAFARHAAIALANAEHYEREHRIAESLQRVLFPPVKLESGSLKIAGKYQPAWDEAQVGGDFYDYFDLGGGVFGVAIGDVSGKGLDAAVHTAIVKYSFQAYLRDGLGPAEALLRMSEALVERTKRGEVPDNIFITMFCAIVDSNTGRMVYANAGHEPPVKLSSGGDTIMLNSTGPILGILTGLDYEEQEITLDPGDVLALYTDGITEARTEGNLFGQTGLVDTVQSCTKESPQQIAERIHEQASAHARGIVQDDIAIVIIQRSESAT